MRKDFYVYTHSDPSDGHVFYVGKGCKYRAWNLGSRKARHKYKLLSLKKKGLKPVVTILKSELTEEEAFNCEREQIQKYKSLNQAECNLTDGGEGNSGWVPTVENKQNISNALKGKPSKKRGQKMSAEQLANQSGENSYWFGRKRPEYSGEKNHMYGKPSPMRGRKVPESSKCLGEKHYNYGKPFTQLKPVVGVEISTNTMKVFKSITEANTFVGSTNVSCCCRGRKKSTKGWTFSYLTTENEKEMTNEYIS